MDPGGGGGGGGNDDVTLPKATLTKMIREAMPGDLRCASECVDAIIECCTEFVQLLSAEANDLATGDGKAMITPDHVMRALAQLGFEEWADDVRQSLADFKEEAKSGRSRSCRVVFVVFVGSVFLSCVVC